MKKVTLSLGMFLIAFLSLIACSDSITDDTIPPDPYSGDLTRDTTLSATPGSRIADHDAVHELWNGRIPVASIQAAKATLHIAYGHTSHGSQLITGLMGIPSFAESGNLDGTAIYSAVPGLFDISHDGSGGSLHLWEGAEYGNGAMDHDAGYFVSEAEWNGNGHQQNWYLETREFLDDPDNAAYNVVIWSWCGQLSWYSADAVRNNYLTPMDTLRADYHDITFVYMTGHLDGTGLAGNLHANNEIIRQHCRDNDLWLYDFADIESWDPDGYCVMELPANDECYWDSNGNGDITGDDRNWAQEWQTANPDRWFSCSPQHSEAINGNMKGYAAWWLWTQITEEMSP